MIKKWRVEKCSLKCMSWVPRKSRCNRWSGKC